MHHAIPFSFSSIIALCPENSEISRLLIRRITTCRFRKAKGCSCEQR